MMTTAAEVNALSLQARALLAELDGVTLPEWVHAAANKLSTALEPFESIEGVDQRLIYTDPPRCQVCQRQNIKLATWRRGNTLVCEAHRTYLESMDALPPLVPDRRERRFPLPFEPLEEEEAA